VESASINVTAKPMLPMTISEGRNQKLDRALFKSCLSLFMSQIPLPVANFRQVFATPAGGLPA
jgi:hypothetical protein